MSVSSIELIILDFRYFIDDALTFLEFFECGERDTARKFVTSPQEIATIRQHSIEFTRLLCDLKENFFSNKSISDFNLSLAFSKEFKQKRVFFFKTINTRLENLYTRIFNKTATYNDLVKIYFNTMLKIARNTNEFIGFVESSRWQREIAVTFMDNLIKLCNDFSCVYEQFVLFLEQNHRVVASERIKKRSPPNFEEIGPNLENKPPFAKLNKLKASAVKSVSSLVSSFSYLSLASKYNPKLVCPCVLVIMMVLIVMILFLIVLPFFRMVSSSSDPDANLAKRSNFFSLLSTNFEKEAEKSLVDWSFILSYLSNFYVISFTFVIFIAFECGLNK